MRRVWLSKHMKPSNLIVVGGFAGAGKSPVAEKPSRKFGLAVFSSDESSSGLLPLQRTDFNATSPS